jgi:hypothetical protein
MHPSTIITLLNQFLCDWFLKMTIFLTTFYLMNYCNEWYISDITGCHQIQVMPFRLQLVPPSWQVGLCVTKVTSQVVAFPEFFSVTYTTPILCSFIHIVLVLLSLMYWLYFCALFVAFFNFLFFFFEI